MQLATTLVIISSLTIASSALAAATTTAQAGPDVVTTWPALQVELAGSASAGTPHWYQVSGPANARLLAATSATTTVALPQTGSYVFRLVVTNGPSTAHDDVTITLQPSAALTAQAQAADHIRAVPQPVWKSGHRLLPLNRHDFGIPAAIATPLSDHLRYSWSFMIDEWTHEKMDDPGWPEYAYAQAWAANPGAYQVTALYGHAVRGNHSARPAGWPDEAFLRDADGALIDFEPGAGVLYKLSPLAPDSLFTAAGTAIGANMVQALGSRGIPISGVADQGEWGLGIVGFEWNDAASRTNYELDPRIVTAMNADPIANGSIDRFLSIHIARHIRLVKEAVYAAAGLDASIPWYGYSGTGITIDRGRWGAWSQWAPFFEDAEPWLDFAGEEFYLQGDGWTNTDGGGTPTGYMHRLLNTASAQRVIAGRSRMVPWISAGWDLAANSPWVTKRERYTGFMKMLYTCGSLTVFQDDYANDQRIRYNEAIGSEPSPQVWGWIDAAHVHALFSFLDADIIEGELLPGPDLHPFMSDPAAPRPLCAFRPAGDPTAWVVVRKRDGQDRWLITAFAATGSDRTVTVTVPGLGELSLRARAAGSVYTAVREDAAPVLTWWDEDDALRPTALWFPSGPGVVASAAPSGPGTPPDDDDGDTGGDAGAIPPTSGAGGGEQCGFGVSGAALGLLLGLCFCVTGNRRHPRQ